MIARPFIDSVDFARNGKKLRGEIGLGELPRLGDMLAKSGGSLTYILRGFQNEGRDMLEVSVQGICPLKCQRCLGELDYAVDFTSRLQLLPADRLDEADEDDEMDSIEASSRLDVLSLIEDELLLKLPFAPKHPQGECASANNDFQGKASPFSVLAGLKK